VKSTFYSCPILNLNFLDNFRRKIKFHENPSRGSRDVSCSQTDRQTDRQTDQLLCKYIQDVKGTVIQILMNLYKVQKICKTVLFTSHLCWRRSWYRKSNPQTTVSHGFWFLGNRHIFFPENDTQVPKHVREIYLIYVLIRNCEFGWVNQKVYANPKLCY
jgi:hypothetical protein